MKILTPFLQLIFLFSLILSIFCHFQYVSANVVLGDQNKADEMLKELESAEQAEKDQMKKARGGTINEEHTWMDGLAADVEMNCPSLKWTDNREFNPTKKEVTSSLRCATCNLMKEFMLRRAQLLVLRGRKPSAAFILEGDDDGTKSSLNNFAGQPFCEAIYESYHLRERTNGERVWSRRFASEEEEARFNSKSSSSSSSKPSSPDERKTKQILDDRAALMKTHLVSANVNSEYGDDAEIDPSSLLPVKYHTPNSRRTLPCARYFLKQLCFKEIEAREEPIDNCFDGISSHIEKFRKKKNVKQTGDKIDVFAGGMNGGREEWVDILDKCLGKALVCEKKFCNSKAIAEAKKKEWLHRAWYEGCFGNQKFAYIPDLETKGRNMLNPYRKGGEKEKQNPWLNGTWQQVSDVSMFAESDGGNDYG